MRLRPWSCLAWGNFDESGGIYPRLQGQRRGERLDHTGLGRAGLHRFAGVRACRFVYYQHVCGDRRGGAKKPSDGGEIYQMQPCRQGDRVRVRLSKVAKRVFGKGRGRVRGDGRATEKQRAGNRARGLAWRAQRRADRKRKDLRGNALARVFENEKFRQDTGRVQSVLFLLRYPVFAGQEQIAFVGERGGGNFAKHGAGNCGDGHRRIRI